MVAVSGMCDWVPLPVMVKKSSIKCEGLLRLRLTLLVLDIFGKIRKRESGWIGR